MIATGIVRRIDEHGRIVLPIELRRTMVIEERDRVEIYLEGDLIIVRKSEQTCLYCGCIRRSAKSPRPAKLSSGSACAWIPCRQ